MSNPYDVDISSVKITYSGFNSDFYCFRVHFADQPAMVSCMKQMELSQWLFDNATTGNWFMGNDFPYPDQPKIFFENAKKNDTFIIFKNFVDVVLFEREFAVTGITPTMLVP